MIERLPHMNHARFAAHKTITHKCLVQGLIFFQNTGINSVPGSLPDIVSVGLMLPRTQQNPGNYLIEQFFVLALRWMDLERGVEGGSALIEPRKAQQHACFILPQANILIGVKNSILVHAPDEV